MLATGSAFVAIAHQADKRARGPHLGVLACRRASSVETSKSWGCMQNTEHAGQLWQPPHPSPRQSLDNAPCPTLQSQKGRRPF